MVTSEHARALALALPGAEERDHHGRPSFRVGGRIFATLWSESEMNVMVDAAGVHTHVTRDPGVCTEVWWGTRLAAVRVALAKVRSEALAELLADAWEHKGGHDQLLGS